MKKSLLLVFSFLIAQNVWSFESGKYVGSNKDIQCEMYIEQQADRALVDYECLTAEGVILQSGTTQTYMFGSFGQEVEDESGTYIESGFGSDQLLEYKIVKTSDNDRTWLEQIKNLGNSNIHYLMSFDNENWIDLDLSLSKK